MGALGAAEQAYASGTILVAPEGSPVTVHIGIEPFTEACLSLRLTEYRAHA
jgi:hypothetical protein